MTAKQVHDEVITIFMAGHESSAVMMSWALGLLAHHPEEQERITAEAFSCTEDTEMEKLPILQAVVQETMRLCPPVWSMGRLATRDTRVGDLPVPKGTNVWLCLYRTHHDSRWWADAERFQPERWLKGFSPQRHSFLPFGLGQRMCVGQHLVMLEATICFAAILRRFRLQAVAPTLPGTDAWLTLRPRGGMQLRLISR